MISVSKFRSVLDALATAAYELEATLDGLPTTTGELRDLLADLARAERACTGHFKRYADDEKRSERQKSQACKDHWFRCWKARDTAISALTRYALATVGDSPSASESAA